MLDFLKIAVKLNKGVMEIIPKFTVALHNDLMIKGSDFYAIWDDQNGLWSTSEFRAMELIDEELRKYYEEHKGEFGDRVSVLYLWDGDTGMTDKWHKYCQKQMPDHYHPLDESIIFSNTKTSREDYASRRLPYAMAEGSAESYEKLIGTLYSPEEKRKLEWAIGAIISGDSKRLQKFIVMYGGPGTGKSTMLNIVQKLFSGYYSVFDAQSLGSRSDSFALEPFKMNPLVAIQHDGDLSRIEDNTRLNSIVSHETMTVNEKFKSLYATRFNSFLFMGTNKPVRITDAKSGILRRLIDVSPTGEKVPLKEYDELVNKIDFELGAIAWKCLQVYQENPDYYDHYTPVSMMAASNDFFNFVLDSYEIFSEQDGCTLKGAWDLYKVYCDEAKVPYPYTMRVFKEELKSYFREFQERGTSDGIRIRNYYSGFRKEKFEQEFYIPSVVIDPDGKPESWIHLMSHADAQSAFDILCADCPAQYADESGKPSYSWDRVKTKLFSLDPKALHYVLIPENHIVIDFDLTDENGEKSLERNLEAAALWPETYAEVSKSGKGLHLHYIYDGDPEQLSSVYAPGIEVKVYRGLSSLRRKLTLCTTLAISHISSGLPLKEKKVINDKTISDERHLRALVEKGLKKQIANPYTKPCIDYISDMLDKAYEAGIHYDLRDLTPRLVFFAAGSSNNAPYCLKKINTMKLCSEEVSATVADASDELVFYDVEVFPNLFLVNWKYAGEDKQVVRMINPSPEEIEDLLRYKLVGFNCRRYDNHILYARMMGYTNEQLFEQSKRIIDKKNGCFFGEAYNLSYTDVYDFCSTKQSLKKWEIELGIHHQELGLPWDQPVPEELWLRVAEYCDNDVIATEAVFNARQADWKARLILSDISGLTPNDTTNSHTTAIIFGKERNPQNEFIYTDLSTLFPGYKYDAGVSTYRGENPGEGGYVYAEPGMYENVALLDIASMHPTSLEQLQLFGPRFTEKFSDIKRARIFVKHKDYESAGKLFEGKLTKYLGDDGDADDLAYALKIAINSVYGLTSASFPNKCRDPRNVDNIVAKRGALFMIDLKHAVQELGYTVAHIKTDSIKIPNATPEIISFIMEFGKKYGYNFEHEATYSKMCLVNDAVYIAQYASVSSCEALYGAEYVSSGKDICKDNKRHPLSWTATGAQFAVPYVFKTLFSKEELTFRDLCETKTVSTSLYLDMNERLPEGEHNYIFIGKAGLFCPIREGCGGGVLVRENSSGGYDSATGAKGWRWMESEMVRELEKEDCIDYGYYQVLADKAVETISQYGDMNWFSPGWNEDTEENRIAA